MGYFVRGNKNSMGCYVRGDKNSMGCFVQGGKSLWDVLSGVAKMAWDVLSRDVVRLPRRMVSVKSASLKEKVPYDPQRQVFSRRGPNKRWCQYRQLSFSVMMKKHLKWRRFSRKAVIFYE